MKKDFEKVIRSTSHVSNVLYAMRDIAVWSCAAAISKAYGWRFSLLLFLGIGMIPQVAITAKCLQR